MEISLDMAFIRGAIAQEHKRAQDEIRDLGVLRAYESSRERHDLRIASAPDIGTLACRSGCTWCCYFSVDVRAVEAFSILDFVESTLTAEEKARIYAELRANSTALRNMDENERMRRNIKCPFLSEGDARYTQPAPQTCRNYHATDAAGCQQSYEDPNNSDIDPEFAPWVYQAGGAHVDAFTTAMREAGYDTGVYELNCALQAAMSEPGARERFESGASPFISLNGEDVPLEFGDLD